MILNKFLIILSSFKENECDKAVNEYDFDTPKPLSEKLMAIKSPSSRRWLWIFLAHLAFLFTGIVVYCGCKQMLLLFYNHSFRKQSRTTRIRTITERRSTKANELLLPKFDRVSLKKAKVRTQYLRLGSIDHRTKKV